MATDLETLIAPDVQAKTKAERPICCARCGQVVAQRKARRDEEHTFRNPAGYSFHVVVFEKANGCKLMGEAVAEASWFDDYSWTLALCSKCEAHPGWSFSGRKEQDFFGLIATRLTGL